jgi:hypothetical protein
MKLFPTTCIAALSLPAFAWAEAYDRPIPQAQSATAEFWYAFACITFVLALVLMARLVSRR